MPRPQASVDKDETVELELSTADLGEPDTIAVYKYPSKSLELTPDQLGEPDTMPVDKHY